MIKWAFFISILVLLYSCGKDEIVTPIKNEDCDIVSFKNAVNNHQSRGNYLVEVMSDSVFHTLQFDDGMEIKLCNELINSFSNIALSWETIFSLKGGDSLHVQTFDQLDYQIHLNPYTFNPLSASVFFSCPINCSAALKVIGKHGTVSDLSHDFKDYTHDHEIDVFGLYPNHLNLIEISLYDANGKRIKIDSLSIQTKPITVINPNIKIEKVDRSKMQPGQFHLISSLSSNNPTIPYMIDDYGEIRWLVDYRNHPTLKRLFYDTGIEQLRNGNLYFGDTNSHIIFEIDFYGRIIKQWSMEGYGFHHNVKEKKNGNFLVTANKEGDTHLNGRLVIEDHVIEIDRLSGNIIKVWDFKNLLDENRNALGDWLWNNVMDWLHINAVEFDESDNTIVISGRHQGVVKVGYNNDIKWILAPHKGWGRNRMNEECNSFLLTPVDQTGIALDSRVALGEINHESFEWNWYQHAAMIKRNGNIMLFDNGESRNFLPGSSNYSRAVEFEINEEKMTVQQIWQYGKERGQETYSQILSDVDYYMETNNVLFCPGYKVFNGSNFAGGRIVEVDYDTKEVVFEALIISSGLTFHRVERIDLY